jgi:hypothetical protein
MGGKIELLHSTGLLALDASSHSITNFGKLSDDLLVDKKD